MNEEKPNLINITDTNNTTNEQLNYQLSSGKNDTPEHAKKKKIITIIIIVVVVLLLIGGIITKIVLDNRVEMYNGYVADLGETLHIKEITTKLDINVIGSLEKQQIKEITTTDEYLKLKLSIKNINKNEIALSVIAFSLTDKDKRTLATRHITLDKVRDDLGDMHFAKNETKEGYIYFSDKEAGETKDHLVKEETIENAKYLKVTVLSYAEETNPGMYNTKYEEYYLAIK